MIILHQTNSIVSLACYLGRRSGTLAQFGILGYAVHMRVANCTIRELLFKSCSVCTVTSNSKITFSLYAGAFAKRMGI